MFASWLRHDMQVDLRMANILAMRLVNSLKESPVAAKFHIVKLPKFKIDNFHVIFRDNASHWPFLFAR